MALYLVRHGIAKPAVEDPERALTPQGIEEVTKVAKFLAAANVRVDIIYHSGKKRAEQTAAIFAQHLKLPLSTKAVSGLAPDDPVVPIVDRLLGEKKNLMLVGHLPFVNRLASFLTAGDSEAEIFAFSTASVLCLKNVDSKWQVAWMISPDLLP